MKKKMAKIVRELEAAGHKVTDLSKQGVKSIGFVGGVPAAEGSGSGKGRKIAHTAKRNQPN
jgi:hypothetical protein